MKGTVRERAGEGESGEMDHEEDAVEKPGGRVRALLPFPVLPLRAPGYRWAPRSSFLPDLPSTVRGRDWTVVTVVTMVPSGMMVRSSSTFLVGVMLGRGVEGVGFRGEPSSY